MKYVVILGDGMADYPVKELNDKTPLEVAKKPYMDMFARTGMLGLAKTITGGYEPGSDVANLSVMGYNPEKYYTGRSPIEAVSIGIDLKEDDIAFRCNLVTLKGDGNYDELEMLDYSADEISTYEAEVLIKDIEKELSTELIKFYSGICYRHCMVWSKGPLGLNLTPPHNISGKKIKDYLPKNPVILEIMKRSKEILNNHPINKKRIENGLNPANSVWLWGEGTKLNLPSFEEKYSISGAVVSAVDLVKGLGICAGLEVINVENATGNIHTNYEGKANACIKALESGKDFVYVHIEAPDECGHRYEIDNKVKAIELIDEKIIAPIFDYLEKQGDYRIMVLPDHPTPLILRTHTSDPIPFVLSGKGINPSKSKGYSEQLAKDTKVYIDKGYVLMDLLFN